MSLEIMYQKNVTLKSYLENPMGQKLLSKKKGCINTYLASLGCGMITKRSV